MYITLKILEERQREREREREREIIFESTPNHAH